MTFSLVTLFYKFTLDGLRAQVLSQDNYLRNGHAYMPSCTHNQDRMTLRPVYHSCSVVSVPQEQSIPNAFYSSREAEKSASSAQAMSSSNNNC